MLDGSLADSYRSRIESNRRESMIAGLPVPVPDVADRLMRLASLVESGGPVLARIPRGFSPGTVVSEGRALQSAYLAKAAMIVNFLHARYGRRPD